MGFDPEKHHRHSIRLEGYAYTLPGVYFVTMISYRRVCIFGEIVKGMVELSLVGDLVKNCWLSIPNHFESTNLDEYVLMPNHLHGIIFINESRGKGKAFASNGSSLSILSFANALPLRQVGTQSGSLNAIVQNFKSVSTRLVNKSYFKPGNKIWQRNYYERIIRNERELNAIRQYICDNPLNWERDEEYVDLRW
jgi:REP element-mobilizing transposase RayT